MAGLFLSGDCSVAGRATKRACTVGDLAEEVALPRARATTQPASLLEAPLDLCLPVAGWGTVEHRAACPTSHTA